MHEPIATANAITATLPQNSILTVPCTAADPRKDPDKDDAASNSPVRERSSSKEDTCTLIARRASSKISFSIHIFICSAPASISRETNHRSRRNVRNPLHYGFQKGALKAGPRSAEQVRRDCTAAVPDNTARSFVSPPDRDQRTDSELQRVAFDDSDWGRDRPRHAGIWEKRKWLHSPPRRYRYGDSNPGFRTENWL